MKKLVTIALLLTFYNSLQAQEGTGSLNEEQLETLVEKTDAAIEDDSYLQQLEYFKKHPLSINKAGAEELSELNLLSGLQIQEFILYRKLFGKLLNIYELQSIPGWDIGTIKNILAFISVEDDTGIFGQMMKSRKGGEQSFLFRYASDIEKSKGYYKPVQPGASFYAGDRAALFFRYKYNYKNVLQWGLLGDKDAGEQFFKGAQKQGFDFYSFHLYMRSAHLLKALALGDFTVNLGQGLIQWQSLAFKKGADITAVKRQAPVLRPYNSAGEYNFHRGVGITLEKSNMQLTIFGSYRRVSTASFTDTLAAEETASSFQPGGYHRTPAEIANRNNLVQIAYGGNIKYSGTGWHTGINIIHYGFSKRIQKTPAPYQLFAFNGSSLTNASIDYSYTYRNIHLFAEAATDNNYSGAVLSGAIISIGQKIDASVIYRNISSSYHSLNGNAFTENSSPANEKGLYMGASIRPSAYVKIDAYADVFRFPWLKYQVNALTEGADYFIHVSYQPTKQFELFMQYKNENKPINQAGDQTVTALTNPVSKQDWRIQCSIIMNKKLTLRHRVEMIWYDKRGLTPGEGFLFNTDCFYKPFSKSLTGNFRWQYFETNGFNSRVYAYESDLLYAVSVPFYYDKGWRYYINVSSRLPGFSRLKRKDGIETTVSLKWSQTIYPGKLNTGSGLDEVQGNKRSEIKLQVLCKWKD